MEKETFNYEKTLCATLIKAIDKLDFLTNKEKQITFRIAYEYKEKVNDLYKILEKVMAEEQVERQEEEELFYEIDNDVHVIRFKNNELKLSKDNLVNLLIIIIEIVQEILPIGTVVNLNEEFEKKLFSNSKGIKIIIINRFLTNNQGKYYFPYGGVPYPIGDIGANRLIHFTRNSIKDIVHMGFKDFQEEAYVFLAKNKIIINNNMRSIEFATKEEIEKYNSELKNK